MKEEDEDVTKIADHRSSIVRFPETSDVDLVLPVQGTITYDGRIACPHCGAIIVAVHRCGVLRRIFKRNEERQARADAHNLKYIETARWVDDDRLWTLYDSKRFVNKNA